MREHGITSVPSVKFFRLGKVAHTFPGAALDTTFRQALQHFIASGAGGLPSFAPGDMMLVDIITAL